MAFGDLNRGGRVRPMADINMVPLIDVMLVLLVIFIVTAPLLTHAVKLDLPRASNHPNQTKPDHIQLAITAQGDMYWNGETIDKAEMKARLRVAGRRQAVPELHLQADRTTRYQVLAEVMSEASTAGLNKISFVSSPDNDLP